MSTPAPPPSGWDVASVLAEPTRRAVYDTVRGARRPVSRDDVARDSGVNRRLAAFHLDRLAEAGLLTVDYARPPGRSGPGAGRPAKLYSPADVDLDLTVPPRHYELAARMLARAVSSDPAHADTQAMALARTEGQRIGALRRPAGRTTDRRARVVVHGALTDLGYEPSDDGQTVTLQNCPFHAVADVARQLVCGMNCELVAGLLDGLAATKLRARLRPDPPNCCVVVDRVG